MDLEQHLLRAMAFSRATWGPGERMEGVRTISARNSSKWRLWTAIRRNGSTS